MDPHLQMNQIETYFDWVPLSISVHSLYLALETKETPFQPKMTHSDDLKIEISDTRKI